MKVSQFSFGKFVFVFTSLLFLFQTEVSSQPSFKPDKTPACDSSVAKGAQKALDKLVYDYTLRKRGMTIWMTEIYIKEKELVYEAKKYYNCDLSNMLNKKYSSFYR